ncbi:MAG: prohibitin family protein [Kordiimonadaceae bacterium]|nr:prohibitin family protein [Kordiimonadaceae bacterium]
MAHTEENMPVDAGDGSKVGNDSKLGWKKTLLNFMHKLRTGLALSVLVLLFVVVLFWETVVVSHYPGQQGVYWSRFFGGTSNMILGEGTNFKFPWDDIIIYDMRLSSIEKTTTLLSKDGMEMEVQWSIRFRPKSSELPELHRKLGPDYARRVVLPEAISSLRQILGNYRAEEIFAHDENSLLKQLKENTLKHFGDYPVYIKNVLILRLVLPKDMAQGIVKKLLYEQEMLAYNYRLEAATHEKERLRIEAEGLKQFEEISKISMLKWRGIAATVELAKSENSKIIVIGTDSNNLPLLLNTDK